jgi:hypothetical protein
MSHSDCDTEPTTCKSSNNTSNSHDPQSVEMMAWTSSHDVPPAPNPPPKPGPSTSHSPHPNVQHSRPIPIPTTIQPTPKPPTTTKLTHLKVFFGTTFSILLLLLFCTSIILIILLVSKPEIREIYPEGIMCATCEQIGAQNPSLLEGRCYGKDNLVSRCWEGGGAQGL